jgi:hypothetical protein
MKLEFSRQIFEKPQIQIFIEIRPVGGECHAKERTEGKKDGRT